MDKEKVIEKIKIVLIEKINKPPFIDNLCVAIILYLERG